MPRIAVLVDTSTSWGRRIHAGIHAYDRRHGPWQLFAEPRGLEERLRLPSGWRGDGVIARITDVEMAWELETLGVPVVNVSAIELPGTAFPRVCADLAGAADVAARHFVDRGFRHFGYFSLLGPAYVATHRRAFEEAVRRSGGAFHPREAGPAAAPEASVAAWLQALPKPAGLLTWNPSDAREILYACEAAGLLVPEEVAVLSGTDDELLCALPHVPLSGVLVAAESIGYEAARRLHALLRRGAASGPPVLVAPAGVISRRSTETLAVDDRALCRALTFIRENASRPLQVAEIAREAGVSRRILERRFVQVLGRSPAAEIRRAHLERARQLLAETDLSIADVAEAAGFSSPEYFAYVFRAKAGQAPGAYRAACRRR